MEIEEIKEALRAQLNKASKEELIEMLVEIIFSINGNVLLNTGICDSRELREANPSLSVEKILKDLHY